MADANRTLLVEMLSRRIHFETEAGGLRFQHSGVVIAWLCPAHGYEADVGYSLLIRDDATGADDFYGFRDIRLLGRPVPA